MPAAIPSTPSQDDNTPWRCGGPFTTTLEGAPNEDPWNTVLREPMERDVSRCDAWKDEIRNLLTFAGLFSAVVTPFAVESYKTLQPKLAQTNPDHFSPTASDVRVNVLWFLSLVFSLATAMISIVSLQWLREHQRPRVGLDPRVAIALHHMRAEALEEWYLPQIFYFLPFLLQCALVLFLFGLVDFLWSLNHMVAIPVTVAIGLIALFIVATSILPTVQNLLLFLPRWTPTTTTKKPRAPCPYKSPSSWMFHLLIAPIVRFFMCFTGAQLDQCGEMNHQDLFSPASRKNWTDTFPRASGFIFRKKSGDTWFEHEVGWLFQRDCDEMATIQDITKCRPSKRPVPVYDIIMALQKSKESTPIYHQRLIPSDFCVEQILHPDIIDCGPDIQYPALLRGLVHPQISYGLPDGIKDPANKALNDPANKALNDSANKALKDRANKALIDHTMFHLLNRNDQSDNMPKVLKRRLVEICIRLTDYLHGDSEARHFEPAKTPVATNLPIQWVARQLKNETFDDLEDIQHQTLEILVRFFENSARDGVVEEADLGKALHLSSYLPRFLSAAATIVSKDPTDSILEKLDLIVESLTCTLEDYLKEPPSSKSNYSDYFFYTAFIFANSLSRVKAQYPESLRALLKIIPVYYKQVKVNHDFEQHLGVNHAHCNWDDFYELIKRRGIIPPKSQLTRGSSMVFSELGTNTNSDVPSQDAVIDIVTDEAQESGV